MIKHGIIVVPTDFSAQSSEALRRACVMAGKFDTEVHLLHVIEPPLYIDADLVLMTPIDAIVQAQHDGAAKRLAEQAESAAIPVTTHLLDAVYNSAQTICEFSRDEEADLIVIGRHGEKGVIEHMLLGSTAERVVRHAPCSVLVVMEHGLFASEEE